MPPILKNSNSPIQSLIAISSGRAFLEVEEYTMAPNVYLDSPIDSEIVSRQLVRASKTTCILHEIRALGTMRGNFDQSELFDFSDNRGALVPPLIRKITRTLAERWSALEALDPTHRLEKQSKPTKSAAGSELVWRQTWQEASTEDSFEKRLLSMHYACMALSEIEGWFEQVKTDLANHPKLQMNYKIAANLVP